MIASVKRILSGAVLWLLCTSLACAAADRIFINGHIITVDDRFAIAQAIAVEDGRIVQVGDNAAIQALAGADSKIVDLGGKTVIPGLIDTHSHVVRASQLWTYEVRLDGVTSRTKALELLEAKAQQLQPGDWLMSFGGWVEEQFLDDPRGFSLDELDAIAPDHPVFLDINYSHRYVNSVFLERANILVINRNVAPSETVDTSRLINTQNTGITEAMVERDAQGRATGRINGGGFAYSQAFPLFPELDDGQSRASLKAVVAAAVANGLTTIYDGGGFGVRRESYAIAAQLAQAGELDMRIFHAQFMTPRTPQQALDEAEKVALQRPEYNNDRQALIGLGEVIYTPHQDGFERAMEATDENLAGLKTMLTAAASGGWGLQLHMVQPSSMNLALNLMDELSPQYSLKPLRWIFIHADMIDQPVLERMRPYGMTPSLRSNGMLGGAARQALLDTFGEAGLAMPDLRGIQDSGIPWTFGSEAPRINVLNPLMSLAWAVTGQRFYDGGVVNNRTVSREEALIAHTRNGALSVFQENNLGQIRNGFQADFVVLDRDYLTVPEDQLYQVQAVMTVVGGKTVYTAGH